MTKISAERSIARREVLVKAAAAPALLGYAASAGARAAGRPGVLSRAANWASSKLGRYKELMTGGNKELVGGYNAAKDQVRKMWDMGLRTRNQKMTGLASTLYGDLLSARFGGRHVSRVFRDSNGIVQKVTDTEKVLSPQTISELNKVLGARAATATGVTGAGLLGYNAVSGGDEKAACDNGAKGGIAMTPYEQGFTDKCAELGVDPAALVKKAQLKLLGRLFSKRPVQRLSSKVLMAPAKSHSELLTSLGVGSTRADGTVLDTIAKARNHASLVRARWPTGPNAPAPDSDYTLLGRLVERLGAAG